MQCSLEQLNTSPISTVLNKLGEVYEHSPWVVERALGHRPFKTLAHFKSTLSAVLSAASMDEQLALIRAHPELAGKAMLMKTLTTDSTVEQGKAGLTQCTPQELETIAQLNTLYGAKFGFPFVLAVRGPRGIGLDKSHIIATFKRRLSNPIDYERAECLRQINRIAEIRLDDKFGTQPTLGNMVWEWHEELARYSEPEFSVRGELTVTYLTEAHRACAQLLQQQMQSVGFDEVQIDAVGNVVGIYRARDTNARSLLTGSHYDTVRNAGKYDGRLGIYIPMMCVRELKNANHRLPFHIEVVGFAEEEGQRYPATFLGSGALTGQFDPAWLTQRDADGVSMSEAMQEAGLPGNMHAIERLRRDPNQYLGFIEVHIEQGPVLHEMNLPLGVVTSINGSVRYWCEVRAMASHAGTTPMNRRRDAAVAVAHMTLAIQGCAEQESDSVATVGQLHVPNGSINVVPGTCQFSIDLRAPTDAQRDRLERDILARLQTIAQERSVELQMHKTLVVNAAPSAPQWQGRWEAAVAALGLPVHRMTSGAGHDAMMLHSIMPQAMLFVRGENAGISHNPLESTTTHDIDLCIQAFQQLLHTLG